MEIFLHHTTTLIDERDEVYSYNGEEPGPYDHYREKWYDITFDSVSLTGGWADVVNTTEEIAAGEYAWVVAVVYTTGSTFGQDHGHEVQTLCITKDFDVATDVARWAESTFDLPWPSPHTEEPDYKSWIGYFEKLDYVAMQCFKVRS
jgi:hypothetical protein